MRAARLGRPPRVLGEKPTRDRILEAAVDLFSSQGYDRTSMRELAVAVRLTESAVYRHFPSKDAVLAAILAYTEGEVFSPLPEPRPEHGSIFRQLLLAPIAVMLGDPFLSKVMRIMYAEMLRDESLRAYYKSEFVERANRVLEGIFKKEIEEGRLRDCDVKSLAVVFNSFRSEWAFQNFLLQPDAPMDRAVLERGLEGPLGLFESLLSPS